MATYTCLEANLLAMSQQERKQMAMLFCRFAQVLILNQASDTNLFWLVPEENGNRNSSCVTFDESKKTILTKTSQKASQKNFTCVM